MTRPHNTLSLIEAQDLSDQIDQVMMAVDRLNAYYKVDPSISDLPHWQRHVKTLAELEKLIENQLNALKAEPDCDKKSKLLKRINDQRNRIIRFSPSYIEHLIEALKSSVEQGDPSTEVMDALKTDPWAIAYFQLNPKRQAYFNALYEQAIKELASDITEHNRQLFMNIPRDEILNLNSEECPHYLAQTMFFNQLSGLIQEEILASPSTARRTAAMERWILISKACFDQNDFSSALSMKSGLNSAPIYRLKATKESLSTHAKSILESYEKTLNRQGGANKKSENFVHIPHMGVYRNQLDHINTKLPKGQLLSDSKKAAEVADNIIAIQAINKKIAKKPSDTLLQKRIQGVDPGKNKKERSQRENLLQDKSKKHEPSPESGQPKDVTLPRIPIFNKAIHSNLALLKNKVLVDLMLQHQVFFKHTPSSEHIRAINEATEKNIHKREFSKIIKKAGLELKEDQIKSVDERNRQMFYCHLIENDALRNIAKREGVKRAPLGRSTRKQILAINKMLGDSIAEKKLGKLLKEKLGLSPSPQELREIIKQAKQPKQTHLKKAKAKQTKPKPIAKTNAKNASPALAANDKTIPEAKGILNKMIVFTLYDYAKHHPVKTFAGTLFGGILVLKLCPILLPALAATKLGVIAIAELAAKFGVGAAAGATTTTAVGAAANRSSFFHKRNTNGSTENTTENNTITPGNH